MRIAVYGRVVEDANVKYFRQLFDELHKRNIEITVFDKFLPQLQERLDLSSKIEKYSGYAGIKDNVDYLFSLGGDGTLLDTVTLIRDSGIPVMGINVGRLGFLSSVGKEEILDAVEAVENGTYVLDPRDLIHLDTDQKLFGDISFALNEFTLHKKDSSSMIVIHAYINGEYLNSYYADGLIVATPTGSTAYSLSCGGPVIYPSSQNFVITPVAPHHLNVRPLVVPDDSVISFELEGRSEHYLCTLDSRMKAIDTNIRLSVRKETFKLNLMRLYERNFLTTLRNKLLWGYDKRN